ncbi:MAG: sodium:solute symporter [Clostridiales bacterium]|nr:sodium:solute symporter [Clostridiales bacterium]
MFWKIFLVLLFFAVTVAIGFMYRKTATNSGDFILAGRNVGPWLSAFAYGTTYFSATIFVGYAGQFGWMYGISALWIGIGNAFIGSLLAWVVLGRRTRIMTNHLGASTMPEFFSRRYDSPAMKLVSALIIIVFLVPYTASVYKGLAGIFSISFGLPFIWCIVGMAALTAIYVVAGGYMATAVNSFLQGIVMLVGIVLIVGKVLAGGGGFMESLQQLSQFTSEINPELNGALTSMFGPDPLGLLSVVVLTSLGVWGMPQMIHKFYAIKDERSIRLGTIISTVFAVFIACGSYFIGGFGRLFYSADPVVYDDIVPTMLTKTLPDILIGIVLIVVLSASISTLASLVIISSSTVVRDFLGSFTDKIKEKTSLALLRAFCVLFIVLSVLIAAYPSSMITALMGLSWGALAGSFLGPFIYGLFWKRTTKVACWVSMVFAVGLIVSNAFLKFASPSLVGAAAMVASLIIVPVVSLITPRLPKATVDSAFIAYDDKAAQDKVA